MLACVHACMWSDHIQWTTFHMKNIGTDQNFHSQTLHIDYHHNTQYLL